MLQLNTRHSNLSLYLLFAAIFCILLILNIYTPLWGDDWWRAVEVDNFFTIFSRIGNEYNTWTGRISVIFFTFLALLKYPFSLFVFALLNSLMFCLLIASIFRGGTGRWPTKGYADLLTVFSIFVSVWFLTDSFGESILWKTGAIAYLWIVTFSILLLNPFIDLLADGRVTSNNKKRLLLLPIMALLLAIGLENVSVSMSIFMIFTLLVASLQSKRPPLWYWLLALGQVIGSIILVTAPGNFVRYEAQSAGLSLNERFNGLIELIWQHFSQDLPVIYLFIVLLSILSLQQLKVQHLRLWLWLLVAIMFSFSMAGSTGINFQYRTAFVTEIVVIIGLTTLLFPLWQQAKNYLAVVLPASSILLLIWSMDFITVFEQYYATFQQEQRRIELRSAYTQNKIKKIYLPSMKIPGIAGLKDDVHEGRYFLRDLHGDKKDNEWRNGSYANYHGFEFAWRVKQPYLIFLPELLTNPAWKIHKNEAQMMLFSRIEQLGYQSLRALYLISPKTSCIKQFSIQASDKLNNKSGDKLGNKSGKKNKTKVSIAEVAIVNSTGFIDESNCISRLELKHNSKQLRLKSSRFNNLSLDLNSSLNLKQLPAYMLTKVNLIKTWQACRLPRQAKTISTAFFCTATNAPNMAKGIMTYGPYHPIAPGQYRASIKYQAEGNAGTWDQVIQYDGSGQYLSQQPLPDTRGKIVSLNHNFRVTKPHGKLEIRSYYNGMGKLTLYSIKLSSLK